MILDGFVSLDETLADRGIGAPASPMRTLARTIDRLAFRRVNRVIVDTAAHARRFAQEYGLQMDRAVITPVGAQEPLPSLAAPLRRADSGARPRTRTTAPTGRVSPPLRVLYFGGFIPLHGVPVILDAARRLGPDAGVTFELIGDGQDADEAERRLAAEALHHVRLDRTWMPEGELVAHHIATADVCLGIFADRPKTRDVVPAKLYLALACGRTVVTADTPAVREEILSHAPAEEPPVLVGPPGDGAALASALIQLRDDPQLRAALAARGRAIYEERFTPARVVADLARAIEDLTAPR
jgi:glycosyltransferase involved in cell wall biosynthesis